MQDISDQILLEQYVKSSSEAAFGEIVRRHINLVHGAALRKTSDSAAAHDITQIVFILFSRKAGGLPRSTIVSGWLYQTTRLTAANYLRSELRRIRREQEAYMQSLPTEPEPDLCPRLAPFLEDAMGRLSQKDRDAVLLRFVEEKSFGEIAAAFGATENAAKKRVHYALEKLRRLFLERGVSTTTAVIAGALGASVAQGAPADLAGKVTAAALAKGATAGSGTAAVMKGTLKIMAWTKIKTLAISAAVVIGIAGFTTTGLVLTRRHSLPAPHPVSDSQTTFPKTAWAYAGYGDPVSSYVSFLWSHTAADFKALQGSLTPQEASRQLQELHQGALKAGKSVEAYFASRHELPNVDSFKVLSQRQISPEETILEVQMRGPKGLSPVGNARMKKTGTEWKFDGIESAPR